jgi:hypothetical protein
MMKHCMIYDLKYCMNWYLFTYRMIYSVIRYRMMNDKFLNDSMIYHCMIHHCRVGEYG